MHSPLDFMTFGGQLGTGDAVAPAVLEPFMTGWHRWQDVSATAWPNAAPSGIPGFRNDTGADLLTVVPVSGGGWFNHVTDGTFMETAPAYSDLSDSELIVAVKTAATDSPDLILSSPDHPISVSPTAYRFGFNGSVEGDDGSVQQVWKREVKAYPLTADTWYVVHAILRRTGASSMTAYNADGSVATTETTTEPMHAGGLAAGLPMPILFGSNAYGAGLAEVRAWSLSNGLPQLAVADRDQHIAECLAIVAGL